MGRHNQQAHAEDPAFLQLVQWLPDDVLLNHVVLEMNCDERRNLRSVCGRARRLANLAVRSLRLTGEDLQQPSSQQLLCQFPFARELVLADGKRAAVCDAALQQLLDGLQQHRSRLPSAQPLQQSSTAPNQPANDSASWHGHAYSSLLRPCARSQVQPNASSLPITTLDMKRCHYVSAIGMRKLVVTCPLIQTFKASRWVDSMSVSQLTRLPGLQHLDLGDADMDVPSVDDASLVIIGSSMPQLRSLSLQRCISISDTGVATLGGLTALLTLNLSGTRIHGSGFGKLFRRSRTSCSGSSSSLEAQALAAGSLRNGARTRSFGGSCSNSSSCCALQHVDLSACRSFNDDGLESLALSSMLVGRITQLSLANTQVSNAGLVFAASRLLVLQQLDLGSGFELSDGGLQALSSCPALEQLTLGNFNVTLAALPGGFLRLRKLKFGGCFGNQGIAHVLPLPILDSIVLWGLDAVTDKVLAVVALQPSLRSLTLSGGYSLSPAGLQQLSKLPHLSSLSLTSCPLISPPDLQLLLAACPSLPNVQLRKSSHDSSGRAPAIVEVVTRTPANVVAKVVDVVSATEHVVGEDGTADSMSAVVNMVGPTLARADAKDAQVLAAAVVLQEQ